MVFQSDVLQTCLQEAVQASRSALERCIDDAVAGLQVAETQATKMAARDEISTAWRDLLKHKAAWCSRYPEALTELLQSQADEAAKRPLKNSETPTFSGNESRLGRLPGFDAEPSSSMFGSLDSFSLVDDAHVSKAIASSRLLQQVLPVVDLSLGELNKLISTVQGLPNVQPERNPLRPENFANVLREVLAETPAEPAISAIWIKNLAPPFARELKRIYERIVNLLELANVQGASYRVLQTPASAMRSGSAASGDKKAAAGRSAANGSHGSGPGVPGGYLSDEPMPLSPSQYADLSEHEMQGGLLQDFLFHGGSHAQHALAPAYYATIEEELRALKATPDLDLAGQTGASAGSADKVSAHAAEGIHPPSQFSASALQSLPVVNRPQRNVDAFSQLSQQVWGAYGRAKERALVRTELKQKAQRVGQVLGLEVVRKLVNQVAQDPRLLVPVREAIVALEPSLLRLAMHDPRFFSEENHPGRRLMERVAQRSFKYNDEFSAEFQSFYAPVADVFNQLNGSEIADALPFGGALEELEQSWSRQDQQEQQHRNEVLKALRFAEERQALADQIAFDMSARSDLAQVPGLVLEFLFGPWALAMAHAKLQDTRNQIDPMGLGSAVPDLVWSVKREVTLKLPVKLIEMIPGLLGKLHAGLALLGHDPRESEAFFEALMRLHRPVLKLRRLKSKKDAAHDAMEPSAAMPLEPEEMPATPEQLRAKAAEHPWMGRGELDAAGFQDTMPSQQGDLLAMDELSVADSDPTMAATLPMTMALENSLIATPAAIETPAGTDTVTAEPLPPSLPLLPLLSSLPSTADATSATPPIPTATAALSKPPMEMAAAEKILLSLRTGTWVDLYSKRHWLRAQLIWASSKGSLFMFVSHGGQPHSMTKRICERLIREHLLRPVDSHGVVAQALNAVAEQASADAQAALAAQADAAKSPSAAVPGKQDLHSETLSA